MKRKMKNVLIFTVIVLLVYLAFGEERYIKYNVIKIDKVDTITMTYGEQQNTFDFNDEMFDLFSYSGSVIEVDNMFERLFFPYGEELEETELSITYLREGNKYGKAKVYYNINQSDEYVLYMNNVYWTTGESIEELFELLQLK